MEMLSTFYKSLASITGSVVSQFILLTMCATTATYGATGDMSVDEVLANRCQSAPDNFSISTSWNQKLAVIDAWCVHPKITQSSIPNKRKPQAFADGSSKVSHDASAALALNGAGAGSNTLGTAPNTVVTFGSFCLDAAPLFDAEPGDVVFTLRSWNNACSFMSSSLPTIPLFGIDNSNSFVGDDRSHYGIQIATSRNWGLAIDYYSPGGASSVVGGGNLSYALSEFAGMIVALNTALISAGHEVLTNATIKEVLDASSDEVYLEVEGFKDVYKESELNSLLENSSNNTHYHGQIVNLQAAISYALTGVIASYLTIVKKVVNDDSGTAVVEDFNLAVNAATSTPLIFDDKTPNRTEGDTTIYTSNAITVATSTPYMLSEINVPGYAEGDWNCTNDGGLGSGPYDNGNVTVAAGESVSCTISNNDIAPSLTLTKDPTNDSGGSALPNNFQLKAGLLSAESGVPVSSIESNTDYQLSETLLDGYAFLDVVCTSDIDDSSNEGTFLTMPIINLVQGENVACTITNDDIAPELVIMKEVINENEGEAVASDFTLRLSGGGVYDGSVPRKSGELISVNANTVYTLSEDQLPGYSQTSIECKDTDTSVILPHPITLAEGQSVHCTISNIDYVSTLYVIPLPNNGAAAFNL